ncbi:MAG: transporter substrate-binding domain-containing protein [Elsteraceae bacterium]
MGKGFKGAGIAVVGVAAALAWSGSASAQTVVNKIKQRGYVSCGASQGVPGLSRPDEQGVWRGFDSDMCRAIAVAIFGDKEKIRFVPLNAAQRLPAIQTGEIDALSRSTTLTYTRDAAVRFVVVTLYDNDSLMVRKSANVKSKKDLNGLTVCLQGGGSLTEDSVIETEQEEGIAMKKVYFDSTIQARDAYFAGRCDSYVTDGVAAAGQRATVAKNPDEHEIIAIGSGASPNGIAIARGDDQLFDIVRWAFNAMVWAEKNGVTQANIDEKAKTGGPPMTRVLGGQSGFGKPLGLDDKWAYNVIKQLGNYGEIWDRNIGKDSALKVPRNYNALYRANGLNFPLPWN